MGENMEPIVYKFATVTGLKSNLEGIAECHWAVLQWISWTFVCKLVEA